MAFQAIAVNGLAGFRRTATRESLGTASFKSSSRFPPKFGVSADSPVTLPPGFARLARGRPPQVPSDRDDRDRVGRLLGRQGAWGAGREDDVRREADQFARKGGKPLLLSLRPREIDDEIPPLHVSKLTEALAKRLDNAGFERRRGVP